jgi:hypothetical protein
MKVIKINTKRLTVKNPNGANKISLWCWKFSLLVCREAEYNEVVKWNAFQYFSFSSINCANCLLHIWERGVKFKYLNWNIPLDFSSFIFYKRNFIPFSDLKIFKYYSKISCQRQSASPSRKTQHFKLFSSLHVWNIKHAHDMREKLCYGKFFHVWAIFRWKINTKI